MIILFMNTIMCVRACVCVCVHVCVRACERTLILLNIIDHY